MKVTFQFEDSVVAAVLHHMNDDHLNDNVTIAQAFGAPDATSVVMTGFDGHRGWVYYLAVSPEHRRKGLGRALMVAAEAWLRERGAPKIQLMVREENEALGFYEALGLERQKVVTLGRFLGD